MRNKIISKKFSNSLQIGKGGQIESWCWFAVDESSKHKKKEFGSNNNFCKRNTILLDIFCNGKDSRETAELQRAVTLRIRPPCN